jgi:threonine dehydratase
VCYSSGNHAQAVALAARDSGAKATIVTLDQALAHKVDGVRRYGGDVLFGGPTSLAIRSRAEALAAETGALLVPPFDDPDVIAGQGTVGLEILEDLPEVGTVIVPVGGGGLLSGVATAVKSLRPEARVVGVEPVGASSAYRSREAGKVVVLDRTDTIADGLKPLAISELTFAHMRRRVDGVVLVTDEQILAAARLLVDREKLVVEPSGAAALAALLHGKIDPAVDPIVVILSGGNADMGLFAA